MIFKILLNNQNKNIKHIKRINSQDSKAFTILNISKTQYNK